MKIVDREPARTGVLLVAHSRLTPTHRLQPTVQNDDQYLLYTLPDQDLDQYLE